MASRALTIGVPGAQLARVFGQMRGQVHGLIQQTATRARRSRLAVVAPAAESQPQSVAMRGTPEIYFTKQIDNSRLVRVVDPARSREMAQLISTLAICLCLVMLYAWQHFSSIEYGYRIESQRAQIESLTEVNRGLQLEQAALRDPERIDVLARRMGMGAARVGQVVPMEPQAPQPSSPVMAQMTPQAAPVAGSTITP
jgi:cell division protein FtsL